MRFSLLGLRGTAGGDADNARCNRLASSSDIVDRSDGLAHDVHRAADDVRRYTPGTHGVFHTLCESLQRIARLARALCVLRLQKIDVVEDLIDPFLG